MKPQVSPVKVTIQLSLVAISLLFTLYSCRSDQKNNQQISPQSFTKDTIIHKDPMAEFLSLFADVNPKGLHIYPYQLMGALVQTQVNKESEGVEIDPQKYPYVDNDQFIKDIDSVMPGKTRVFAIGKFEVSDQYLALIIRHGSQYTESLIDLALWDKSKKEFASVFPLSDSYAMGGWRFDRESWIKECGYGGSLIIVTRQSDATPDKKTHTDAIVDALMLYSLEDANFVSKGINQKDKSKYKLKNWR
jgi:hypothetical protein